MQIHGQAQEDGACSCYDRYEQVRADDEQSGLNAFITTQVLGCQDVVNKMNEQALICEGLVKQLITNVEML